MVTKKTSKAAAGVKSPKVVAKPAKPAAKSVPAAKPTKVIKATPITKVTAESAAKSSAKKTASAVKSVVVKPSKTKAPVVKSPAVKTVAAKKSADKKTPAKKEMVKVVRVVKGAQVVKDADVKSAKKTVVAKVSPVKKTEPLKVVPVNAVPVKVEPVKATLKSKLMSPLKAAVAKLAPKSATKAVETKNIAVESPVQKSKAKPETKTTVVTVPEKVAKVKQGDKPAVKVVAVKAVIKPEPLPVSKKNETKKTEIKKEKLIRSQAEVDAKVDVAAVRRVVIGKTAVMKPQSPVQSTPSKGSSPVSIDMTDEAVLSPPSKESVKAAKAEKIIKAKANKNSSNSPADFKPYEAGSDEEYMNAEQLAHFRALLNKWKQELMEEVDRTVHHMQDESANLPDPADRATQEEEFTFELRTRDRERKLIKKIDQALEALDDNDYGYCESCGVEIGIRRLEARPTATLCIDCKTLDEIKEKQLRGS